MFPVAWLYPRRKLFPFFSESGQVNVKLNRQLYGRQVSQESRMYWGLGMDPEGSMYSPFHMSLGYVERKYVPNGDTVRSLLHEVEEKALASIGGVPQTIPVRLIVDEFGHTGQRQWIGCHLHPDSDWLLQETHGTNSQLLRIAQPIQTMFYHHFCQQGILLQYSIHFVALHAHLELLELLPATLCRLQQRDGWPEVRVWPSTSLGGTRKMLACGTKIWHYPILFSEDLSAIRIDGDQTIHYVKSHNISPADAIEVMVESEPSKKAKVSTQRDDE